MRTRRKRQGKPATKRRRAGRKTVRHSRPETTKPGAFFFPTMQAWNRHIGNIFMVYARADRFDLEWGMQAYEAYRERIGKESAGRVPVDTACGIFAALSPNIDETNNFIGLRAILGGQETMPGYPNNQVKAKRILAGEPPLSVLNGPKTRAFYIDLSNPANTHNVTIDFHMFSVWHLERMKTHEARFPKTQYDEVAADFITVARALHIRPNQLQAIIWSTWKRIHGVLPVNDPSILQIPLEFVL